MSKLENLFGYKEINITPPGFTEVSIKVQGNHAILMIDTGPASGGMVKDSILFTIPIGFRPRSDIKYAVTNTIYRDSIGQSEAIPISIHANGVVSIFTTTHALEQTALYACISYFI